MTNHPTPAADAHWTGPPDTELHSYGMFNFRKSFTLHSKPHSFILDSSGDNAYLLYINGHPVCRGPQLSDVMHWKLDEIDVSHYVKPGNNVVCVTLCNQGKYAAWAQLSLRAGLPIAAKNNRQSFINTDTSWRV